MFVITPAQMRQIDNRAIEKFNIPGIVLMENAALQTVQVILKHYPPYNWKSPYGNRTIEAGSYIESEGLMDSQHVLNSHSTLSAPNKVQNVLVLAGCGNNGGDGLAIARHLYLAGYHVNVLIVSEGSRRPKGDAEINLNALLELEKNQAGSLSDKSLMSLKIHWLEEEKELSTAQNLLKQTHLIVDALFGTGLDRPVKGLNKAIIDEINSFVCGGKQGSEEIGITSQLEHNTKIPVVAVDIPSGINGNTGQVMGAAISATHSVAFNNLKPGHLLFPGREYSGQVHVVPISLPSDSEESVGAKLFTLTDGEAAIRVKPRSRNSHKGTFGKAAVIAGSTGMTGAACLTAQAAMRSGAGLVTLGIPSSLNPIMEQKLTEVMTYPLEDKGQGHLIPNSLNDVVELLKDKDVLAFGPGCGKNSGVFEILRNILGRFNIPIVIDADGLNHISKDMNLISSHKASVILTPHPGEMARLTGLEVEDIVNRPLEVAAEVANKYGCILLLKGAASVVAEPNGRVYINASGSSGMAKGGSGDILTGIIASLIAQGYTPFEATVLACFIHGRAGERAAFNLGETGMTAEDLMNALPYIFKQLLR